MRFWRECDKSWPMSLIIRFVWRSDLRENEDYFPLTTAYVTLALPLRHERPAPMHIMRRSCSLQQRCSSIHIVLMYSLLPSKLPPRGCRSNLLPAVPRSTTPSLAYLQIQQADPVGAVRVTSGARGAVSLARSGKCFRSLRSFVLMCDALPSKISVD